MSAKSKANHGHKSVKVLLNSKWRQTPLYLEVAEFLAEENPAYFWSFLESLHEEIGPLGTADLELTSNLTQQLQYETSLRLASSLLRSESKLSILKFSLSLRSYSPTVAIFRQTTDDLLSQHEALQSCDWIVEFSQPAGDGASLENYRRFNCKLDDVKSSLSSLVTYVKSPNAVLANPLLYSVDHTYPTQFAGAAHQQATVILYANIGTAHFRQLHTFISKAAAQHGLKYVLRYFYPVSADSRKVALSGYGVELAIKSTEYKAQDDTRVRGEASTNPQLAESEKPDEMAGFVFSKLKTAYPNQVEKLDNFYNYLVDTDKEIATLKAWELQEISLQAVTKVLSVPTEDALKHLRDISQNFPSVARSLVKITVDEDLKREIVRNQHHFMQSLSLGTSDTAFFINGLYHDIESVDVFSLFDTVKQEFTVVNRLYSLLEGDSERIKKFVKLDVNMEKTDFQIDIRDGAVLYINDIETDR